MSQVIKTKRRMYKLLRAGKLGNTARIYNTIGDVPDGEVVGVRYSEIGSMSRCIYGIKKSELPTIDLTGAVICEYPQDKADVVMNAEVMEAPGGIYLRYKLGNMIMRDAMKSPDIKIGLTAWITLMVYMDDVGFSTLLELFNNYPGHVVEFTVFDKAVGTLESPTIFWEVRNY